MLFSFFQILYTETNRDTFELLSSTRTIIDNRIKELNNIAIQINDNPDMRKSYLNQNFINSIKVVNNLRNISLTNTFYSDIFLYYKDSDLIYSNTGTYRLEHFFKQIYRFEKWNKDSFMNDLYNITGNVIRPTETVIIMDEGKKYLTYIVPLPYNSKRVSGILFFLIEEQVFINNINMASDFIKENIIILDQDGKEIIKYSKSNIPNNFLNLINSGETKIQKINNKRYSISCIKSEITKWQYIAMVPVTYIYGKLRTLIYKVVLGYTVVTLIGFIIIVYMAKMNYKPVKDIIGMFGNDTKNYSNKNEYETIKSAVRDMNHEISSYHERYESSIPILRQSILLKLFKGYYLDSTDFQTDREKIGIEFNNKYFTVIIISITNTSINNEEIIKTIEEYNKDQIQFFCVESIDSCKISALVTMGQNDKNVFQNHLLEILRMLQTRYNAKATIGVGKTVTDIMKIGNAYLEASTALDYRFIKGSSIIIYYNELEKNNNRIDYFPKKKLEALEISILKAKEMESIEIIADLFEEIKSNDLPVYYAKFLGQNIFNLIFESLSKNNLSLGLSEYKYADITHLAELETLDELSIQIAKFCVIACILIKNNKNNESDKSKISQMNLYIRNNFHKCEFSIYNMAKHFGMPVSRISSYYKFITGKNISEEVNNLRLEYAKKLITETDSTLDKIVENVGYISVSSFIRKFKKDIGVTPGEYRALMKTKNKKSSISIFAYLIKSCILKLSLIFVKPNS